MRISPVTTLLFALALLSVFPAVSGCGGSGSGAKITNMQTSTPRSRGRMRLVIEWPPRSDTRLIPALTDAVNVTVYALPSFTVIGRASLSRPEGATQSEEVFEDLPPGNVRIDVAAAPVPNNVSTNNLAIGSATAAVSAGQTTEANIVMTSTIARLVRVPGESRLAVGKTYPQTARAEDQWGALVLTIPGNIATTSDNPLVVSVEPDGSLTARSAGRARLTVREQESGVATLYDVEAIAPDPASQIPLSYDITELGPLPQNAYRPEPYSLNDRGQVVGYYNVREQGQRGFVWENGTYTTIPPVSNQTNSLAFDINNRGQVAGGSDRFAFVWENGAFVSLVESRYTFQSRCIAYSINEAGEITGTDDGNDTPQVKFKRRRDGTVEWFGEFFGRSSYYRRRSDLNEAGSVLVWMQNPNLPYLNQQPGLWEGGDQVRLFPAEADAQATAVNDSGAVVGSVGDRATYWRNSSTQPIFLFPYGPRESLATDVNNHGLVIGYSNENLPFISRSGEASVLLKNIPLNNGSGWVLDRVNAINDRGQMVGMGYSNGRLSMFLLTPRF